MLPRVLTPRSASSKGGEEGGVKFDRSCFGIVASNANYVTLGSAIQKVRAARHPLRQCPCVPLGFVAPFAARRPKNRTHARAYGLLARFAGCIGRARVRFKHNRVR